MMEKSDNESWYTAGMHFYQSEVQRSLVEKEVDVSKQLKKKCFYISSRVQNVKLYWVGKGQFMCRSEICTAGEEIVSAFQGFIKKPALEDSVDGVMHCSMLRLRATNSISHNVP